MKKLFLWVAAAALAHAAAAQEPDDPAAQRARIAAERAQVESRLRTEEKDCYGRFAVNDCLNAAKARRREAMADLRRQEISLNDADRKRKGAERQRAIEERRREMEERSVAQKKQQAGQAAPAGSAPRGRQAKAARPGDRAQAEVETAEKARAERPETRQRRDEKEAARLRRAQEAAQNVKTRQESQAQAEEHRASVNKRLAERKKPPARPLPVPP
jgi:hypothetical protein